MIGKIILIVLLTGALIVTSYFLYQNIPGEPEEFKIKEIENDLDEGIQSNNMNNEIEYGKTPVFYPNMRFNHNHITYYTEQTCSERKDKIEQAFSILQSEIEKLSFSLESKDKADILIGCSEDYLSDEENHFVAGEGGPSEIINTSLYYVILQGKIQLYRESKCDFPVVETHELLHVFGFDHSDNPKNIMYNFSSCEQYVTQDIIDTLNSLYSVEALSDLYFERVNATKKGRYLDFDVEVRNKGLIDTENVPLSIVADENEKPFETLKIELVGIQKWNILSIKNLKLPSRNTEKIKFIIDKDNKIKELNEQNNEIILYVE